jgi:hypothetical protein
MKTATEINEDPRIPAMIERTGSMVTDLLNDHLEHFRKLITEENGVKIGMTCSINFAEEPASLDVKISYSKKVKDGRHAEFNDPNQPALPLEGTALPWLTSDSLLNRVNEHQFKTSDTPAGSGSNIRDSESMASRMPQDHASGSEAPNTPPPVKRGRGRPPGAKNRPKSESTPVPATAAQVTYRDPDPEFQPAPAA